MGDELTQIPVKKSTRQKLRNISIKGETYDELVNKLITVNEKLEDKGKIVSWFERNFHVLGFSEMKEKSDQEFSDYVMERDGEEVKVKLETFSSKFAKRDFDVSNIDILVCLLENEELPVETIEILTFKFSERDSFLEDGREGCGRILLLLELVRMNGDVEPQDTSIGHLADVLDEDKTTISRWISELSEEGLIERNANSGGDYWTLTPEGIRLLRSLWIDLKGVFGEVAGKIKMTGRIVSGFGEGSYYIAKEGYQKQFREKLGFEPYPGTLDLKLNPGSLKFKRWLKNERGVKIEGFSTEERSYGGAKCFPAKIKEEEAAVILPFRTHHEEDILELISPVKVRDKYDLEDGDELEVEVEI